MCWWCLSFLYVVSSASCRFDRHIIVGLNITIQLAMYYNFMHAYRYLQNQCCGYLTHGTSCWVSVSKCRWSVQGVKGVAWRVYSNIRVRCCRGSCTWEGNILSYGSRLSAFSSKNHSSPNNIKQQKGPRLQRQNCLDPQHLLFSHGSQATYSEYSQDSGTNDI